MGIRSFIKKRILRKDGGSSGDDGAVGGDGEEVDVSSQNKNIDLRTVLQSPNLAGLMESPMGDIALVEGDEIVRDDKASGNDDASSKASRRMRDKAIDDILSNDMKEPRIQEDPSERIRRVKGGGMTEEEKMRFLNTALTRSLPPPKPRGPPIRQKIPGGDDADEERSDKQRRGGSKSGDVSTTSSNDSLWNAITGRGTTSDKMGTAKSSGGRSDYVPVSSLILDGKLKNEDAKRQYIDSITNPDRFASFSTMQSSREEAASEVEEKEDYDDAEEGQDEDIADASDESESEDAVNEVVENGGDSLEDTDFGDMKRRIAEDQQRYLNKPKEVPSQNSVREALESIISMAGRGEKNSTASSSAKFTTAAAKDNELASRLEKAALEQEKRDAEARAAAQKKLQEEKEARSAAQRQREEQYRQQEAERMKMARKQAEELRQKKEAEAAAERARLEALQAQQDEYWANKLKKEQAKKESRLSVQEKRIQQQNDIVDSMESEEKVERDAAKDAKMDRIREEERSREDKHEGDILKEVSYAAGTVSQF